MSAPEWKAGDRAVVEVAEAADQHGWVKVKSPAYIHNLVPASALSPLPAGGLGPVTDDEFEDARRVAGIGPSLRVAINHILAGRAAGQPGLDAERLGDRLREIWMETLGFTNAWTAVARAALRECGRVETLTIADPYEAALCVREDAPASRTAQIAEANARVAEEFAVARDDHTLKDVSDWHPRWKPVLLADDHRRAILAPSSAPDVVGELVAAVGEALVQPEGWIHHRNEDHPIATRLRAALAAVKAQKEAK